jgi:hypothetical protein
VLRKSLVVILASFALALTSRCLAQQAQPPAQPSQSSQSATSQQPQVKVNMLNVCSPSSDEQKEIATALSRIPKQPLFGSDFEVDRGRSSLEDSPSFLQPGQSTHIASDSGNAEWVRLRREFSVQATYSTVQYSFSKDPRNMIETLVFRVRDPKDLLQVSIEDSASAVTTPLAMLGTETPAARIQLERFGKSSVVLARCQGTDANPAPDQSAYEPLFKGGSEIMNRYRAILDAKRMVPEELSRVSGEKTTPAKEQPHKTTHK